MTRKILRELCAHNTYERGELVLAKLKSLGVDAKVQDFKGEKRDYRNIIGRLRNGSSRHHIALAAHYDKNDDGEGAIDNGAGVAELLSVLGKLTSNNEGLDVSFLFFDGEEDSCIGSRYFVDNLDRRFTGVYNVDFAGVGNSVLIATESYDNLTGQYVQNDLKLNYRVQSVCEDKGVQVYQVKSPMGDNVPFSQYSIASTVIFTLPEEEARSWQRAGDPWEGYDNLPTLRLVNGPGDTLDKVTPKTLDMMTDVLFKLVNSYR